MSPPPGRRDSPASQPVDGNAHRHDRAEYDASTQRAGEPSWHDARTAGEAEARQKHAHEEVYTSCGRMGVSQGRRRAAATHREA